MNKRNLFPFGVITCIMLLIIFFALQSKDQNEQFPSSVQSQYVTSSSEEPNDQNSSTQDHDSDDLTVRVKETAKDDGIDVRQKSRK